VGHTTFEKDELKRIIFSFAIQAQKGLAETEENRKKRVIVISGPTGVGKSEFSMMLAEEIGGEIISADSMQVYRGMDIGTAKPSLADQKSIPHYLIDTREVTEPFNVVDFTYEARMACQKILERGGVPIVVGGSGFYLQALLFGPPPGPPSVPELRRQLEKEMDQMGSDLMYERLKIQDPAYAKSITKNDRQKMIRALEIMALTGKRVSSHTWKEKGVNPFDFRCWFLTRPKNSLYERVDRRCEEMLRAGFLDEVRELKKRGIEENPSATRAIGYRQALDYLSLEDQTSEAFAEFVELFKRASRNYVKRQLTWFRKRPLFNWLDLEMHDPEIAVEMIRQDYESAL
jgi:tRNA dimethylallyltransferase